MLRYIIRRIIGMIPTAIIMSIILFVMMQIMPGDPLNAIVGSDSRISEARKEQLRKNMGLDKSKPEQYLRWVKATLSGDLGESLRFKKPIKDIMGNNIKNSFILNISAMTIALFVSIPVGIRSAVKKNSLFDNFWSVFALIGISLPGFFIGLLLIFVFSVKLGWTPISGMVSTGVKFASSFDRIKDIAWHMILPTTVLTIGSLASLIKYVRNSMLEVIKQDYIRTARAKGLSEKVVVYKHAFRNALIPVITQLGLMIPGLFAGATIMESVFNWPGIGRAMYDGVMNQDIPLVLSANMFFAILTLLGNLLSDVGYALADPRIKVE